MVRSGSWARLVLTLCVCPLELSSSVFVFRSRCIFVVIPVMTCVHLCIHRAVSQRLQNIIMNVSAWKNTMSFAVALAVILNLAKLPTTVMANVVSSSLCEQQC